jgi:hypothetical protein
MMKRKTIAIAASMALTAGVAMASLIGGAPASTAAPPAPGSLLRGAIGADYDSELPSGSVNGADWGIDQTLRPVATNLIHDGNVFVVVDTWVNGGGQTKPTTSDGPGPCTGTVAHPTAPAGDVCIYVAGGDNAANVSGYSIIPGSGGSRFGFKLAWDAIHNGDTFIDAVWAYRYPA